MQLIMVFRVTWMILHCLVSGIYLQTIVPSENVVMNQTSDYMLQCPILSSDCTNIQWNIVDVSSAVQIINSGVEVYADYKISYSVNATGGYCHLVILHATIGRTAGHVNCINLRTGKSAKSFHIYIIAAGPSCSANTGSSDGYASDGQTLSYSCVVNYGGGETGSSVGMSWFSAELQQLTTVSRSSDQQRQVSSIYEVVAKKPRVPAYICRSVFGSINSTSIPIIRDCVVHPIDVKYATTEVILSREGSNFVPGTKIMCTADGVPPPHLRWVETNSSSVFLEGSEIIVNKASSILYHCEASNILNTSPVKSLSVMFNNTVNPDEVTTVKSAAGWIVPVVVCVPLSVLLIIVIVCSVWPVCPISRAIRNCRAARDIKAAKRRDELNHSDPAHSQVADSSVNFSDDQPDIVPKPRPKPRPSMSDNQSTVKKLCQPQPPPRKPTEHLSGELASNDSTQLLYADVSPTERSTPSQRVRPPRPQPKRQP